jgi:hypothetical protein
VEQLALGTVKTGLPPGGLAEASEAGSQVAVAIVRSAIILICKLREGWLGKILRLSEGANLIDMDSRLVVVSNRLPLTLRKVKGRWTSERSSGGLVSAMNPLLQRTSGVWIGWSGSSGDDGDSEERRRVLQNWERTDRCFAIELLCRIDGLRLRSPPFPA